MSWTRLGLIAGGGDLPVHVAEAARQERRLACVVTLDGFGDPAAYANAESVALGQLGKIFASLRRANCDAVCFAGIVPRPDFSKLKLDMKAMAVLPRVIAAAARGDDQLLRTVVALFEAEGLAVIGADEIAQSLVLRPGVLTRLHPDEAGLKDAQKALHIAGVIGAEDIGQGAVVCDGLVLAVEAQEGTDNMLLRVAGLPEAIRGTIEHRRGVLAKRPKPGQERRIDLPVIGVSTIEGVAAAGLAGIIAPAGGALVLGRDAVAASADAHGVFVIGADDDG
ncbi:UDP-2,3-diacylglucosamine diphosphatase LpxI [Maricaulaceae bacterium NA33B04]|nr:UDP-2,3-diacylglucosamine diphosphatase LpxI [Maricaulaceae bacterium NA33B04]